MRCLPLVVSVVLLFPAACKASSARASAATSAAAASQTPAPEKDRIGVVVPVEAASIALWPDAYAGELLLLEVLPHGSTVASGDTLAKLSTRAIDEQVENAALELRSAEVRHQGQLERNAVDEEAARSALAQAQAALGRAQRALAGWKNVELTFAERGDEVRRRYEAANVDDQKDELDQLAKMYEEDELTDATEEIVLKRSRRALEITRLAHALERDRRKHAVELGEKLELEQREEAVRVQEEALERTRRTQAIESRAREDAAARSAAALARERDKLARLERDRELFEIRAPRAGVLLHGSAKSLRPGGTAVRHERGGALSPRTDAFVVADPARAAVALDLPESSLTRLAPGSRVTVRPLARPNEAIAGTLAFEAWPSSRSAGDESTHEGTIVLEGRTAALRFGTKVKVEIEEGARGEP